MNILYITSEAAPFIKTGGLADVAGSFPKYLKSSGEDIRVVLPLYRQIEEKYKTQMNYIGYYYVDFSNRHKYCGVFELEYDNVKYYFIDNEEYFNRNQVYGEFDDAERFIFFSKACVVLPRFLDFNVDVIHANDWHTGLVPVYVNDFRIGDTFYENVKTVYTIHNINYQGRFGKEVFYITGLDQGYFNSNDLEYYEDINFMKAGIVHSTKFNTVSNTYANEIKNSFFANGLENIINFHSYKLSGIVNGLDYSVWNPKTDKRIYKNYDIKNISNKSKNKLFLQERYGLDQDENICMIGIVSRLTNTKGIDLIRHIFEELIQENIQFIILGTGENQYEESFKYFEYKYPNKVASRIYFDSKEAHLIYSAVDLYMMPSITEPCGISQLIAMRYGALPIVRETGGLKDTVEAYNRFTSEGTGFSFRNINAHELLFKTKEAIDLYYNNTEQFSRIRKNAMEQNFDWQRSANKYLELYKSL